MSKRTSFHLPIGSNGWSGETCDPSYARRQQDDDPGQTWNKEGWMRAFWLGVERNIIWEGSITARNDEPGSKWSLVLTYLLQLGQWSTAAVGTKSPPRCSACSGSMRRHQWAATKGLGESQTLQVTGATLRIRVPDSLFCWDIVRQEPH